MNEEGLTPDFEKFSIDMDEEDLKNMDIKINPDFYIHNGLVKMQEALNNPNLTEGIVRYGFYMEMIEVLAKSSKMLPDKYEENVQNFQKALKEEKDDRKNIIKLANHKLGLIMGELFNKKTLSFPLEHYKAGQA